MSQENYYKRNGNDLGLLLVLVFALLYLFVLIGHYYLSPEALHGWFRNDDFPFLIRYRKFIFPELLTGKGVVWLLSDDFFRPVTRNFFWWSSNYMCDFRFSCYYTIHTGFILIGTFFSVLAIVLATVGVLFKKASVNKRVGLYLTVAITVVCFASILLLSPVALDLLSWVSNTQSSIPFFIFSVYLFLLSLLINNDSLRSSDLWFPALVVGLLLVFSNVGYFLVAVFGCLIWVGFENESVNKRFFGFCALIGFALIMFLIYRHAVPVYATKGSPYYTSFSWGVVRKNFDYYYSIDSVVFDIFGMELVFLFAALLVRFKGKRALGVSGFVDFSDVSSLQKLIFSLVGMAGVSLVPYLIQTLQRYPYYIFLFRNLVFLAGIPIIYFVVNCIRLYFFKASVEGQERCSVALAMVCVVLTVFASLSMESSVDFVNRVNLQGESPSRDFIGKVYAIPSLPSDLCLVPDDLIRRDKSDPYYPDDFWWTAGFGLASNVYAQEHQTKAVNLSHASYAEECKTNAIGVVHKSEGDYFIVMRNSRAP